MSVKKPHPNMHLVRPDARPIAPHTIALRIDADQARRRAEREHWLEVEQQKYRLPRRGRFIDDMPA